MCKCNPQIRTPFCGAIGCEWPEQEVSKISEVKFREFWIQYPDNAFEFMAVKTMMVWQKEIPSYYPDKHVHVIEYGALAAKNAEIKRLKSELADKDAVLADIARQGYGYQGYYEEDDYKGLAEHATREHLSNQDKARNVLQKYRKSER